MPIFCALNILEITLTAWLCQKHSLFSVLLVNLLIKVKNIIEYIQNQGGIEFLAVNDKHFYESSLIMGVVP